MSHSSAKASHSQYKTTHKFLVKCYHKRYGHYPQGQSLHRINILCGMLSSCIETRSSSLEGLSNYSIIRSKAESNLDNTDEVYEEKLIASDKDVETRKAQTKRWLSSKWSDWETFYAPYIYSLLCQIATKGELILSIDGSETAGDCVTLMLSVIWQGHSIPLIWLTREMKKGHFSDQTHCELIQEASDFLQTLNIACRKVLLGDGEFDGLQLRKRCKHLEWEFVLRTACDRKIDCGGEWARIDKLYPSDSEIAFVEDACEGDNAVLWHNPAFEKPIPLLTNMDLGYMATLYYKKRFTIELLFKQMKSAGFNVHKSKIKGAHRVANLIIVVALAFLITFSIGLELKKLPPKILKKFIRPDRINTFLPLTVALKCFKAKFSLFNSILSQFSNNSDDFFSKIIYQNVYG